MLNLLLVSRAVAKKHMIQAYYQKIDFIEKTCSSDKFSEKATTKIKVEFHCLEEFSAKLCVHQVTASSLLYLQL